MPHAGRGAVTVDPVMECQQCCSVRPPSLLTARGQSQAQTTATHECSVFVGASSSNEGAYLRVGCWCPPAAAVLHAAFFFDKHLRVSGKHSQCHSSTPARTKPKGNTRQHESKDGTWPGCQAMIAAVHYISACHCFTWQVNCMATKLSALCSFCSHNTCRKHVTA